MESRFFISTICRACGVSFSRDSQSVSASRHVIAPPPSGRNTKVRKIHCHRCGTRHDVSASAKATICPGCNTSISMENVVVSRHLSKPIDTRGTLRIEKGGNLFSSLSVCGDAVVEGKITGALICQGRLVVYASGTHPVKLKAREILIPGGADFHCPFPIEAENLTVRGRLRANLQLRGQLTIMRGGEIVGSVMARAIQVDRGGHLFGRMQITPKSTRPATSQNPLNCHSTLLVSRPNPGRKKLADII